MGMFVVIFSVLISSSAMSASAWSVFDERDASLIQVGLLAGAGIVTFCAALCCRCLKNIVDDGLPGRRNIRPTKILQPKDKINIPDNVPPDTVAILRRFCYKHFPAEMASGYKGAEARNALNLLEDGELLLTFSLTIDARLSATTTTLKMRVQEEAVALFRSEQDLSHADIGSLLKNKIDTSMEAFHPFVSKIRLSLSSKSKTLQMCADDTTCHQTLFVKKESKLSDVVRDLMPGEWFQIEWYQGEDNLS